MTAYSMLGRLTATLVLAGVLVAPAHATDLGPTVPRTRHSRLQRRSPSRCGTWGSRASSPSPRCRGEHSAARDPGAARQR